MPVARRPRRPRSDRRRRSEERECAKRRALTCYAAERPCRKARSTPMAPSIGGRRVEIERKKIRARHPTLARVVELYAGPNALASNDTTNLASFGIPEYFS